jgi:hypothetical protein
MPGESERTRGAAAPRESRVADEVRNSEKLAFFRKSPDMAFAWIGAEKTASASVRDLGLDVSSRHVHQTGRAQTCSTTPYREVITAQQLSFAPLWRF